MRTYPSLICCFVLVLSTNLYSKEDENAFPLIEKKCESTNFVFFATDGVKKTDIDETQKLLEKQIVSFSKSIYLSKNKKSFPKLKIILFARKKELQRYCQKMKYELDLTYRTGLFAFAKPAYKRELVISTEGDKESFISTIQHEAFHAYLRNHINYPPQWLNEGLAELFESSNTRDDDIVRFTPHPTWLVVLNKSIKDNALIPLEELLTFDKDKWYMDKASNAYAQSWALCYYLMLSKEKKHANIIEKLLLYLDNQANRKINTKKAIEFMKKNTDMNEIEKKYIEFIKPELDKIKNDTESTNADQNPSFAEFEAKQNTNKNEKENHK